MAGMASAPEALYCHECRNQWRRRELGLQCPRCTSDFTEILETDDSSREWRDEQRHIHMAIPDDPEEQDIDELPFSYGRSSIRNERRERIGVDDEQHSQMNPHGSDRSSLSGGAGTGILDFIGSLFTTPVPERHDVTRQDRATSYHVSSHGRSPTRAGASEYRRSSPAPVTHTTQFHGHGFRVTMSTSTGGNLFPRDAYSSQPFQDQPYSVEQLMHQMLANIGATSSRPSMPFTMANSDDSRGPHEQTSPFEDIFRLFGASFQPTSMHGDAVFSQEAMDRVITRLMEQHQSGNAPGPASAPMIAAIPRRAINNDDFHEQGRVSCSICMDEVSLGTEMAELPCRHWFHYDCIKAWLVEHNTCPHCRKGITTDPT